MANVTRYDPFSELDDLFRGYMLRPVRIGGDVEPVPQIRIEVKEDEELHRAC